MSDIKVDDAIKKAEAELYELEDPKKFEELPPEIPDWIIREQEHLAQALETHNKRKQEMKQYFDSLGLPWDYEVAKIIDPDGPYAHFAASNGQDRLEEFKENANRLAMWFKKANTKIGGLL